MLLQLEDQARKGNGERNLMNQKLLILLFKSVSLHIKYVIETVTAVFQLEIEVTERMPEELNGTTFPTGAVLRQRTWKRIWHKKSTIESPSKLSKECVLTRA